VAMVAKGKWKTGNGNKWSYGGKSSGKWGNGKGGGKFGNSRNDAGLNGVVGLVWSIEDRRGFSALAQHCAGSKQGLEGNEGTFHGIWLTCFQ